MTWGQWFRENSDKLLLAILLTGFLAYNLHLLHEEAADSQIQFINGLINTTLGALLGMITGALIKGKTSVTSATMDDPKTGINTSVTTVKEGQPSK